jgi:hypothetical protein
VKKKIKSKISFDPDWQKKQEKDAAEAERLLYVFIRDNILNIFLCKTIDATRASNIIMGEVKKSARFI